jgi:hypothetical protein
MINIFKFREDILTEINFNSCGTNIKQNVHGDNKEELIVKNALSFLVHYYLIVRYEEQLKKVREYLIQCFRNKFTNTTTDFHPYETDHKEIWNSIIDTLSDKEYKAATRVFGMFGLSHISICDERNLLIKMCKEEGMEVEKKPNLGKYTFKFKLINNKPFYKLNIMSGKDKVFLPLSVSIIMNYAFLDAGKFQKQFCDASLDFLEHNATSHISLSQKKEILTHLFLKYFN